MIVVIIIVVVIVLVGVVVDRGENIDGQVEHNHQEADEAEHGEVVAIVVSSRDVIDRI